jgi:hypothetical protein
VIVFWNGSLTRRLQSGQVRLDNAISSPPGDLPFHNATPPASAMEPKSVFADPKRSTRADERRF